MKIPFLDTHLLQILKNYSIQSLPLDIFLNHYFKTHKALGSKDRKVIAETLFGMIRWQRLIEHLSEKNPSWESRLATYRTRQSSFSHQDFHLPLAVQVSFPDLLWDLLSKQFGEDKAREICLACNTAAPTTIRINPIKTTREEVLRTLSPLFSLLPSQYSPFGIHFEKRIPLFDLPQFKEGLFEMQDEASQLVSLLVKPKPGDQVLDYCAGSGGKTLGFAHELKGQGQIYLHDVRPKALEQAKKRLRRAGIQNAQWMTPEHPYLSKLKGKMDWVLVDAPCSGTGTLRRNPDMKWRFTLEGLTQLMGMQRTIFEKALSFVKPGGHIVYATCSILSQENQQQRDHFLNTYALTQVQDPFCSLPVKGEMDGFFGVVFQKKTS